MNDEYIEQIGLSKGDIIPIKSQSWNQMQPLGVEIKDMALMMVIVAIYSKSPDHESSIEASSLHMSIRAEKRPEMMDFPRMLGLYLQIGSKGSI